MLQAKLCVAKQPTWYPGRATSKAPPITKAREGSTYLQVRARKARGDCAWTWTTTRKQSGTANKFMVHDEGARHFLATGFHISDLLCSEPLPDVNVCLHSPQMPDKTARKEDTCTTASHVCTRRADMWPTQSMMNRSSKARRC